MTKTQKALILSVFTGVVFVAAVKFSLAFKKTQREQVAKESQVKPAKNNNDYFKEAVNQALFRFAALSANPSSAKGLEPEKTSSIQTCPDPICPDPVCPKQACPDEKKCPTEKACPAEKICPEKICPVMSCPPEKSCPAEKVCPAPIQCPAEKECPKLECPKLEQVECPKDESKELRAQIDPLKTELTAKESTLRALQEEFNSKVQSAAECAVKLLDGEKQASQISSLKLQLENSKIEILQAKELINSLNAQKSRPASAPPVRQISPGNINPNPSTPPTKSDVLTVRVMEDKVNIRTGPGEEHGPLMTVQRGTELIVEDKKGDWYRVVTPTDTRGYIRTDVVVELDAMRQPKWQYVPKDPSSSGNLNAPARTSNENSNTGVKRQDDDSILSSGKRAPQPPSVVPPNEVDGITSPEKSEEDEFAMKLLRQFKESKAKKQQE
jgi:hypothetical protein